MTSISRYFYTICLPSYIAFFFTQMLFVHPCKVVNNILIKKPEAVYNDNGRWRKYYINTTIFNGNETFSLEYCRNDGDNDNCSPTFHVDKTFECVKNNDQVICPVPRTRGRFELIRLKVKSKVICREDLPEYFQCNWADINPKIKQITVDEDTLIKWTFSKDFHLASKIYYKRSDSEKPVYPVKCQKKQQAGREQKCSLSGNFNFYNDCHDNFTVCLQVYHDKTASHDRKRVRCLGDRHVCKVVRNKRLDKPSVKACTIENGHAHLEWTTKEEHVRFIYSLYDEDKFYFIREKGSTQQEIEVEKVENVDKTSKLTLKLKTCNDCSRKEKDSCHECKCSEYTEKTCDIISSKDTSNEKLIIYILIVVAAFLFIPFIYLCYRSRSKPKTDNSEGLVTPNDVVDEADLTVYSSEMINPRPHYEEIDDTSYFRQKINEI